MPEGDTVHATARRLHAALAGERLAGSDLRVPRFALADLTGQVVRGVVARGKHLLLRTSAGVTLHSHLGMEGAWHLYRPGQRWRGPGFQVRAVLRTEPWVAVGFRLARCELLETRGEAAVVGHLGPDPLGPDWDPAEAARRLRADPGRAVGTALLDQRCLAGCGNVYKSEVLFVRGVNPWTPVAAVPDIEGLLDLLARMMAANLGGAGRAGPGPAAAGPRTTTGDPRPGHALWVAERAGRPCRRCGTPVRQARQAGGPSERATWWCPSCQPGPGPDSAPE